MSLTAAEQDRRLSFARGQSDWDNVLFGKFGVVRCVTVWVSIDRYGPCRTVIFDGEMTEIKYMDILNKTLWPFLLINEGMTYVRESNKITESEVVRQWFSMHPDIICVTLPAKSDDMCPILDVWDSMIQFVDNHFPLTTTEIITFIRIFWDNMKENSDHFEDLFIGTERTMALVVAQQGGRI